MFKFELNAEVEIQVSGETGKIVGRAEFTNACNSYLVQYKSADGRAVEKWWAKDAINETNNPRSTAISWATRVRLHKSLTK